MGKIAIVATCIALWLRPGHCGLDLEWGDDSDLTNFVTRPDIKAPVLSVQTHATSGVSPGFYFAGPYANLMQQKSVPRGYEACQTGPVIYDHRGELVWSGACDFKNRNIVDFRSTPTANGSFVLSGIDLELLEADDSFYGDGKTRGQGFILDGNYHKQAAIHAPKNAHYFNMHELRLLRNGQSALHLLWKPDYLDVSDLGVENRTAGWVGVMGFREIDVASGKTLFEWWSLPSIPLEESSWPYTGFEGPVPTSWDYLHADSIEKTAEGDYVLSARHTNCIYKISGQDGTILWRLGGKSSNFQMSDDLEFSRQHDVRSVQAESLGLSSRAGVEYLALFNNAGDELDDAEPPTPSSALVVQLDHGAKRASILRRIESPQRHSVPISGNTQLLPNGNTLVSWGSSNYISEHDAQGHLVAEAQFASDRFETYRTYKLDWRGQPDESELVLKCEGWGTCVDKATTVCHVSWNGATEVRFWRFIASDASSRDADRGLGVVPKLAFETKLESKGYSQSVYVEALDGDGQRIAVSRHVVVGYPEVWSIGG